MRVQILAPLNETITLKTESKATILSAKRTISKITMIPVEYLEIYLNSTKLNDEDIIDEISSDQSTPFICSIFDTMPNEDNSEVEVPADIDNRIQQLVCLGFTTQTAAWTLRKFKYDIAKALNYITSNPTQAKPVKHNFRTLNITEPEETDIQYDDLKKEHPFLFEPIPSDSHINDYIKILNETLPKDISLDVSALVKAFIENDYNVFSLAHQFPQFRVGYLEYVLYWVVRTVTERISSQNSWSMAENRFILEMSALGHNFREIDAVLFVEGRNKSEDHRNTMRRTMKRTWILPRFLEQFPSCANNPPGYTDEGIPSYLPPLMPQVVKKPKVQDEDKIIEEVLQNKEYIPYIKKEMAKIAQKLMSEQKEPKLSANEEDDQQALYLTDEPPQKFDERHSRSNWPTDEDQLLLNKYSEAKGLKGNRWEYIRKFLPSRSEKSIYSHYRILKYEIKCNKRPELTVPPNIADEIFRESTYTEDQKSFSELTEMIDIIEAIQVYYELNGNWILISRRMPQFKGGYIAYILYYVCTSLKKTRRTKTWSMQELRFLLEKRVDGLPVQEISDLLANKSPKQVDTKRTQIYTTIRTSPYLKQFAAFFQKCDKEGATYDDNGIPSYLGPMIERFKSEIRVIE
ncbi:Myb-like DNA-binding domain containing protein [Trichomonas vaginalis G3]|uniref:Myb-like DNA-binding domain containing protein n=1 Tax=Trichomonas vaginalis (strain ATCC PRA-98 / G3) TaxID=412133 RepID=A2EWF7_TRIV3|nr:hypothetical protein TVAGG3_0876930 [Trichomonas vaginalis G3]EAY02984.1 Myb-like DNA-binding domain containing protein [Trichomonas vaginalis G3]KAI5501756.1 hypothetical protein TVAGG3_0876930 [Trichomonas vaginalis G3]|eukprot:XP_001315207.1 Myb-like DNA-binding domain containing protein [Trichomonas vaginalis G3]